MPFLSPRVPGQPGRRARPTTPATPPTPARTASPATTAQTATTAPPAATGTIPTAPPAAAASRSIWRWLAPVIFAVAGLLFTTSFQTARGTDLRSDRGLPGLIEAGTRSVADKAARVATLQTQIDDLTASAAARGDTTVTRLTQSADQIAPVAGLTEVDGPVVVVTLDDAKKGSAQLPDGVTPDDLVVHQQDVQAVVNALWRGGAEAMMIQDQRVIATSAVRCVGNTLILQGRVYSPPFVIKAMGKIDALKAALDADPKVEVYRQYVDAIGLGYEVKVITKSRFPAFTGALGLSQAVVPR